MPLARSPWSDQALLGPAVCGLLAQELEQRFMADGFIPARFSVGLHLSADAGAALLLLTPVGALLLGAVVLGEKPSPWQITGATLMLAAAYLGARRASADRARIAPHETVRPAGDSEKGPRD
ncbi:EamA family transporter [Nocardia sp. NPDC088792]|uniref:EamA family transporter n=1 Tax=Nocardia sp. NPDC088792 TaxID=3364332 RepID=UPI003807EB7A